MSSAPASRAQNAMVPAFQSSPSSFGPLPFVIFEIIRECLNGRDLACTMGVNRACKDLSNEGRGHPDLFIVRMQLHWVNYMSETLRASLRAEFDGFSSDVERIALPIAHRDVILAFERTLNRKNAVTKATGKGLTPHVYGVLRRLMLPITLRDRVRVLALECLPLSPVFAFGVVFIKYSWRAHPIVHIPVIALTALGNFMKAETVTREWTLTLGFDPAVRLSRMVLTDRTLSQVERIDRVVQRFTRHASDFKVGVVSAGIFTLSFWAEESIIRPLLPSVISVVWTGPISLVAPVLLGTGLGLGIAYLTQKVYRRYFAR